MTLPVTWWSWKWYNLRCPTDYNRYYRVINETTPVMTSSNTHVTWKIMKIFFQNQRKDFVILSILRYIIQKNVWIEAAASWVAKIRYHEVHKILKRVFTLSNLCDPCACLLENILIFYIFLQSCAKLINCTLFISISNIMVAVGIFQRSFGFLLLAIRSNPTLQLLE